MRLRQAWALSLIVVLACGKEPKTGSTSAQQSIATLEKLVGDVSHRSAGKLRWSTARKGMALHTRDALKTGSGASATVVFNGGGKLEVDEQTLIIIEAPQVDPSAKTAPAVIARVEKGTVRGVARPGAKAMEVIAKGGQRTRISATTQPVTFRVRADEAGKLQVAALKGAAKIQLGAQVVDLQPSEAVEVKDKVGSVGKLPPFPELESPEVDESLRGQDVKLTWKAVADASGYRVQLARSLDFSDLILDSHTTAAHWTIARLGPGHYVWRVSAANQRGWEGEFGFARRFRIAKPDPKPASSQPASRLVSPAPNTAVVTTERRMSVNFRWQAVEGATSYQLVVARRPSMKRRVARALVRNETQKLLRLKQGTFYWNVYVSSPKGGLEPLAPTPNKLTIGRRQPPAVGVPRSINRWR